MNAFQPDAREAPRLIETDLLIVGAGPTGLMAALHAVRHGLRVQVLDELWRGFARGYAAILHPESVRLLEAAGAGAELARAAQRIERIALYMDGERVKELELETPALSLPQSVLEELLLARLRAAGVHVKSPHRVGSFEDKSDCVRAAVTRRELISASSPAGVGEWEPVESFFIDAAFVIGADGYDSRVRRALGIRNVEIERAQTFAIFEAKSSVAPAPELCLMFSGDLTSAFMPLPAGRTRFSFQIDSELAEVPDLHRLHALLAARAAWYDGHVEKVDWGATTDFERRVAQRFGKGRVWLAGDAAHVTHPFGGQSMNVGMREACELVDRIAECVHGKHEVASLERYGEQREREWNRLTAYNVDIELWPNAPRWLAQHARHLLPTLPASGHDFSSLLQKLGLVVH